MTVSAVRFCPSAPRFNPTRYKDFPAEGFPNHVLRNLSRLPLSHASSAKYNFLALLVAVATITTALQLPGAKYLQGTVQARWTVSRHSGTKTDAVAALVFSLAASCGPQAKGAA